MGIQKLRWLISLACLGLALAALGAEAQSVPSIPANLPGKVKIETNVDTGRLAQLMLSWQLQVPPKPGWEGPATRLTILSRALAPELVNGLDALTHGWKDCEGTIFCLGGTSYYPIPVRIITGTNYLAVFQRVAVWEYLHIPFVLSGARADVYHSANDPKGSIWLIEHPEGDYLITGPLVTGIGPTATVVRAQGLAAALNKQLLLDVLVTMKGFAKWEP